jgi:hypothetical protein
MIRLYKLSIKDPYGFDWRSLSDCDTAKDYRTINAYDLFENRFVSYKLFSNPSYTIRNTVSYMTIKKLKKKKKLTFLITDKISKRTGRRLDTYVRMITGLIGWFVFLFFYKNYSKLLYNIGKTKTGIKRRLRNVRFFKRD